MTKIKGNEGFKRAFPIPGGEPTGNRLPSLPKGTGGKPTGKRGAPGAGSMVGRGAHNGIGKNGRS
ncbi:MAG: hypothetical protein H0T69_02420 [Thermoleophilaceae bacterium]|nr:hypothetical protein [Thermoleophilaceae bacterium]